VEAVETMAAAERGEFPELVRDRWAPDFRIFAGGVLYGDTAAAVRGMDSDLMAGVRQRFRNAVASRDLIIWEMELLNPPDNPDHCPPGVAWLMRQRQGRITEVRLYHPKRS
jgi:RNA polymerase sigma-70 factor (ECF subfamily)